MFRFSLQPERRRECRKERNHNAFRLVWDDLLLQLSEESTGTKTCHWAGGSQYVGAWKDGQRDGQGAYTRPGGCVYVGAFKEGKRDGQGAYTWPEGRTPR